MCNFQSSSFKWVRLRVYVLWSCPSYPPRVYGAWFIFDTGHAKSFFPLSMIHAKGVSPPRMGIWLLVNVLENDPPLVAFHCGCLQTTFSSYSYILLSISGVDHNILANTGASSTDSRVRSILSRVSIKYQTNPLHQAFLALNFQNRMTMAWCGCLFHLFNMTVAYEVWMPNQINWFQRLKPLLTQPQHSPICC